MKALVSSNGIVAGESYIVVACISTSHRLGTIKYLEVRDYKGRTFVAPAAYFA